MLQQFSKIILFSLVKSYPFEESFDKNNYIQRETNQASNSNENHTAPNVEMEVSSLENLSSSEELINKNLNLQETGNENDLSQEFTAMNNSFEAKYEDNPVMNLYYNSEANSNNGNSPEVEEENNPMEDLDYNSQANSNNGNSFGANNEDNPAMNLYYNSEANSDNGDSPGVEEENNPMMDLDYNSGANSNNESVSNSSQEIDSRGDIDISNFCKPAKIQSTVMYELVLELISKYLYSDIYLYTFKNKYIVNLKYSKNEGEPSLKLLVDTLISFSQTYPNEDPVSLVEQRSEIINKKTQNIQIENYNLVIGITGSIFTNISEQIIKLINSNSEINFISASLYSFFTTVSKINKHYNDELKDKIPPKMVNDIFSKFQIEDKYLICTTDDPSNNFFAYWIINLLFNFNFSPNRNGYISNMMTIQEEVVKPSINAIMFIFLNSPNAILSLMKNEQTFEKFKNVISENFADRYLRFTLRQKYPNLSKKEASTKKIKTGDKNIKQISHNELDKKIKEISGIIDNDILKFYAFAYSCLESSQ